MGISASDPWERGETNIDVVNNWTKIIANHTLKFGGEIRRVRDDLTQGQTYGPRGVFTYADGQTSSNTPGAVTSYGNDFASFLLDLPNQVGRDVNVGDASWRETVYFAFLQDTWQVTKSLTFTYGLRWEFYPPATPRKPGGFSQYDLATNSLEVAGYGNIPMNIGMNVNAKM
jgi:outer membrane receptor protein involved in Fe transport